LFAAAVAKLDRFGDCAAIGDTMLPLPLLRVPGVEAPLAWPLPPAQARELQKIGRIELQQVFVMPVSFL
jgi:hypothetical protein